MPARGRFPGRLSVNREGKAMLKLPRHLRPIREKVFGTRPGHPLDGNAKARIVAFAEGWTAMHRTARQHRGPITRAFMEVLKALLWGFHNSKTGLCFPSYETIAARAGCNRDTVYEAIKIFEQAEILTWVNRITRIRVPDIDLLGHRVWRWQIIRTSNAYIFRDPLPCAPHRQRYKSENPTGTPNQDVYPSKNLSTVIILDPTNPLDSALIRLGTTLGALPPAPSAVT
jgi:hypothetical protein